MNELERGRRRERFLAEHGWSGADIEPLAPDASFRRYFRLRQEGRTALLMDAPPAHEKVEPFVTVARHLRSLGLRAPVIHGVDDDAGYVLLEDFGDATFTRLLAAGGDEWTLYEQAVDTLVRLHEQARARDIALPPYDAGRLIDEALLLVDWHLPARRAAPADGAVRDAYVRAWMAILDTLPAPETTLVLRDFHVDNLMRPAAGHGPPATAAGCGLLDFQDAVIGPSAYDLVSLLEDARRDLSAALVRDMRERYLEQRPLIDRAGFDLWYRVLGVQRHCKVAGIFVRLCVRDRKCGYLVHIPRVLGLLERGLDEPALAPLRRWLDRYLPDRGQPLSFDPERLRGLLAPAAT